VGKGDALATVRLRAPQLAITDHLNSADSQTCTYAHDDLSYGPFGEPYAAYGSADHSFTTQDQNIDGGTTSGLYDFPFREYHPTAGRWIAPDPLGMGAADVANPQSWNRDSYVMNNPNEMTDPEGLEGGGPPIIGTWGDIIWDLGDLFGSIFGGGPAPAGPPAPSLPQTGSNTGQNFPDNGPLGGVSPKWGFPTLADVLGIPGGVGTCDFGLCSPGIPELDFSDPSYVGPYLERCANGCTDAYFIIFAEVWGRFPAKTGGSPLRTYEQAKKLLISYFCGDSPSGAVKNWVEVGMVKGAVSGAIEGGVTGVFLGEGVGAALGAYLGAHLGLVQGAATGLAGGPSPRAPAP
jgi:RHS repeat-associated protein